MGGKYKTQLALAVDVCKNASAPAYGTDRFLVEQWMKRHEVYDETETLSASGSEIIESSRVSRGTIDFEFNDVPSNVIPTEKIRTAIARINAADHATRIIVIGHGGTKSKTISKPGAVTGAAAMIRLTPWALAHFLKTAGLKRVTRISLVMCHGGGSSEAADTNSFGAAFHKYLGGTPNAVRTTVSARTTTVKFEEGTGRVLTLNDKNESRPKVPGTKRIWSWQDGQQKMETK